MDVYKDFMYQIRLIEFEKPYLIIIREYPTTHLISYVKMLLDIPFKDFEYRIYYGELRKVIYSYLNFYVISTANNNKMKHEFSNNLNYSMMLELFDGTVYMHECSHQKFLNEYQPETPEEREKYEFILSQHSAFMEELFKFGDNIKCLTKQDKINDFALDHFTISTKQMTQLCEFSHIYISKWLADQIVKIRVSLKDIQHRMQTNDTEFKQTTQDQMNGFFNELYELNKERTLIRRNGCSNGNDAAENSKNIAAVKDKMQRFHNYETLARIEEEISYWSKRLLDFEEIASNITTIKTQLKNTKEELAKYDKYEVVDIEGGQKYLCWQKIGENLAFNLTDLEEKYTEACRSLITFFWCRGIDRILYSDKVGSYFLDEYGHQNYITNYGAKFYHVNCMGQFIENLENEKYYFDENGRYIVREGQKLYQLAPCVTVYSLAKNGLRQRLETCNCPEVSCVQKTNVFKTCHVELQDLTDDVLLPTTKITNIENTLDKDAVKFLWDSYGWILPDILFELGISKPKNPIHYLGHLLLNRSHSASAKGMKERIKLANKYRDDILQKRQQEAAVKTRAWKAKLPKRYKAKDYDTSFEDTSHAACAQQYAGDISTFYA